MQLWSAQLAAGTCCTSCPTHLQRCVRRQHIERGLEKCGSALVQARLICSRRRAQRPLHARKQRLQRGGAPPELHRHHVV